MKIRSLLLAISLLFACQEKSLERKTNQDTLTVDATGARDTRPQETAEGLPGYLHCQEEVIQDTGLIDCRLQANNSKIDLDAKNPEWDFTSPEAVTVEKTILEPSSPWHVRFSVKAPTNILQRALLNSSISLALDGQKYSVPLSSTKGSEIVNSPDNFSLLLGPSSSGKYQNWLGLDLSSPTASPLSTTMGSSIGEVQLNIEPIGGELIPAGPRTPSEGPSPWKELAGAAISSQGNLRISGQVPQGSMKISVVFGNVFGDAPYQVRTTSNGFTETLYLAPLNTASNQGSFGSYSTNTNNGTFQFDIELISGTYIGLHGLFVERLP